MDNNQKPKSKNALRVIAMIGALVAVVVSLGFVVGISTIFKGDSQAIAAYSFYTGLFIYVFRGIRKDQSI